MKSLIVVSILCFGANLNDAFAYPESGLIHEQVNENKIQKRQSAANVDVAVTQQLFSAVVSGMFTSAIIV